MINAEEIYMEEAQENKAECDHKWKAEGITENKSHVKLVCVKCGARKEIELFPQKSLQHHLNMNAQLLSEGGYAVKRGFRRRCGQD